LRAAVVSLSLLLRAELLCVPADLVGVAGIPIQAGDDAPLERFRDLVAQWVARVAPALLAPPSRSEVAQAVHQAEAALGRCLCDVRDFESPLTLVAR
jgi:hypothetical protein